MGDDQDIEVRSRVKAYLKWKSIEGTDPALSMEGRQAVAEMLYNDGPQAFADFIDALAGQCMTMLGVICDGDPAEVADTINSLVVSDAQAQQILNPE